MFVSISLAPSHGSQQAAREIVLVQDLISVEAADVVDQAIDQRIVQAADHDAHGVTHQRMVKTR
jgi:hypothetical protein